MAQESKAPRTFYLARRFPTAVEAKVAERYNVLRNEHGGVLSATQLADAAAGADYIFASATETISRSVIEALSPTLKAIGTLSVGFDHINLQAARDFGVAVFYTPDVLSEACAKIGMMLVLNAARRGHEAEVLARSGEWMGWAPTQLWALGWLASGSAFLAWAGSAERSLAPRSRSAC